MRRPCRSWLLCALLAVAGCRTEARQTDWPAVLRTVIPASYNSPSTVLRYSPEKLYDYIDGGADIYLDLGFRDLALIRCDNPQETEDTLAIEIYDMGSVRNAFGIYAAENECRSNASVGRMATASENLFAFWNDRFYVKVCASTPAAATVAAIAKRVDANLGTTEEAKVGYEVFPSGGLIPESIRYARKNLLGYESLTNGFSSSYHSGAGEVMLFFAEHGTPADARAALDRWKMEAKAAPVQGAIHASTNTRGETTVLTPVGHFLVGARGPLPATELIATLEPILQNIRKNN